jgi:hypothetical protein
MTYEQYEKAKKRELKAEAKKCFDIAQHPATLNEYQAAKLLEAQFYMQELDRRHDSWISWRDFVLEAIVIALIGCEIVLGSKQDAVLNNLEKSASATAGTLQALQSIVTALSVDVVANPDQNTIIISNRGNTNLEIWGFKLNNEPDVFYRTPVMLTRGGSDYIMDAQFYNSLSQTLKRDGSETRIPVEINLRTNDKTEYVATCQLVVIWQNGKFLYHTQTSAVNPRTWSDKARGATLTTP